MSAVADPMGDEESASPELSLGVAAAFVLGFGVIFAVIAALVFGVFAGESVGAGAGMVALDLYVLGRVIRAVYDPTGRSNRALWTFIGVNKVLILFGGSWWLLSTGLVHPLGLAAGIGALPLGLVAATLSMSARSTNRGTRPTVSAEP